MVPTPSARYDGFDMSRPGFLHIDHPSPAQSRPLQRVPKGPLNGRASWSAIGARVLIGLLTASSTAMIHTAFSASDNMGAVQEIVRTSVEAWNKDDADALVALFLPGGDFISPSGGTANNREEIKRLLTREHQELFKGTTLTKTIRRIAFPQPDLADVTGVYELSGVPLFLGITLSPEGPFRFHLKQRDGRWMIERAHITRKK